MEYYVRQISHRHLRGRVAGGPFHQRAPERPGRADWGAEEEAERVPVRGSEGQVRQERTGDPAQGVS